MPDGAAPAPGGTGAGVDGVQAAAEAVAGALGSRAGRPRDPLPRWYRRRSPATLQLDCSGGRHRIVWRRGRLVLLDHDVAAETALIALGGERPACLTFYDRWKALFAAPSGPPGMSRGARDRAPAALRSATSAGGDLRAFGAELSKVVESALLVRAERRWADPQLPAGDRQRLVDAFLTALREAFAASLQASAAQRGRQQLALHARPLPSGEEAAAELTVSRSRIELELQLPLGWVIEVAGRGLGSQDDRLVLGVVDADEDGALLGVTGIVWEVAGPGRVTGRLDRWWVRRDGDRWQPAEGGRDVRRGAPLWWTSTQR